MSSIKLRVVVALSGLALACAAQASKPPRPRRRRQERSKSAVAAEFEKFREMMEDASPAELFEAKGEELWKTKRGPKNASLEQCDLGLGPGVIKGAYVRMPRYFADADQVMDAERRIVYCMVTLQGFKEADLAKKPFSNGAYTRSGVAGHLRRRAVARHENRRPAEACKGTRSLQDRPGDIQLPRRSLGFSCASCHGEDGKRIRTQDLPNLSHERGANRAFQGWPGYRMTGGLMHTLQWRMNDCFRQQRFPEPGYASETIADLLTYMGVNANGHGIQRPGNQALAGEIT